MIAFIERGKTVSETLRSQGFPRLFSNSYETTFNENESDRAEDLFH